MARAELLSSMGLYPDSDDSSFSSLASSSSEDTITRHFDSCLETNNHPFHSTVRRDEFDDYDVDESGDMFVTPVRQRSANQFGYEFGNFMQSPYYKDFLAPEVRERTRIQSRSRYSRFRSHFRTDLDTVEYITNIFISRGWVHETNRVRGTQFVVRATLLVMSALEHLGNRRSFRQFETVTKMRPTMHSVFFDEVFLERFVENFDEWVYYPYPPCLI